MNIFDALNIDNATGDETPAQVESTLAELSEAVEKVEEAAEEVQADVEGLTNTINGGEELVEAGEIAQEAVEEGAGLDETAAKAVTLAVESILNRIGYPITTAVVPSHESFSGGSESRLALTVRTVESISGTLKNIWQGIAAFAKRVWDKIVGFFASLFSSNTVMEKHLVALQRRARDLPSDFSPKEKTLKNNTLAAKLSVGEKASLSTFQTLAGNAEKLQELVTKVTSGFGELAASASVMTQKEVTNENLKSYLKSKNNAATAAARAVTSILTEATGSLPESAKVDKAKSKKGVKVDIKGFGPFVGNRLLKITVSERQFDGETVVDFSSAFTESKKMKPATELSALDASEVGSLVGQLLKMNSKMTDWKRTEGEAKKIIDSVNKVTETVISSVASALEKNGGSSEMRLALNEVRIDVRDALNTLNAFTAQGPAVYFSTISAGADYASAALRNLGKKNA